MPQAKGDELDHFRASNMRALRRIAARPETDGPQGGWGLDLGGQGLSEGMTDVTDVTVKRWTRDETGGGQMARKQTSRIDRACPSKPS